MTITLWPASTKACNTTGTSSDAGYAESAFNFDVAQRAATLLRAAGATAFLLSDTILAWNRFRTPLPRGDLLVMITYYAAVFLIALA